MTNVTVAMESVYQAQALLTSLTALGLTSHFFPSSSTVANGSTFDFIIVGGGTAGLVFARRLTEVEAFKVLVIEAGGDPPIESIFGGLFTYQPNSSYDWNLYSKNDNYSAQNHINHVSALTAGKMLGGSSSLSHMIHVRGRPVDYDAWAIAANDSSWGWDRMYPYFLKQERLLDPEILNSSDSSHYGKDGYLGLKREPHISVIPILAAMKELGNKIVLDNNGNSTMGYNIPLFSIDGVRQTQAVTCLSPIKDRPNLYLLKNTMVTKILFNDTTAVGVQAVTSDNETLVINASKEVIVTAGALNTPKLLMLSGIGPKDHLESLGIPVISDVPVGQNFVDHVSCFVVHTLDESNSTASSSDPTIFPVPCMNGYKAMDESQAYPDYQAISLIFPHDSTALLVFCSNVFTYSDEICNTMYNASIGKNLLVTVHNILHPVSRGQILLDSTDPSVPPLIYSGAFSNNSDLVNEASYVADFAKLVNTTYFKSIGSEIVDFNLPGCADLEKYSTEYWQCYTLNMMGTMFHYSGTCSLGSVVNPRLRVIGVSGVRCGDASVMPNTVSGNIKQAVLSIAEKGSDIIKEDYNETTSSSSTSSSSSSSSFSSLYSELISD